MVALSSWIIFQKDVKSVEVVNFRICICDGSDEVFANWTTKAGVAEELKSVLFLPIGIKKIISAQLLDKELSFTPIFASVSGLNFCDWC